MSSDPVIVVNGLGKCYPIGERSSRSGLLRSTAKAALNVLRGRRDAEAAASHHWALKDVSFKVSHGERIGVIGRNGAGKSTLLKIMSRVAYPTTGEIRIRGTLTSLLEVGTGFNDNLSGRENVFLNASLYGMTRAQIENRFDDIVAFSEVTRFIDTPVKNYSSGMKMRLAFAVAAHLEPDILLLDEVLAVGDMSFQRKCLERVDEMTSGGRTLFFVSHSMDSIMRYCDRCIWLDGGAVRMDGDVQDVISAYVEAVLRVQAQAGHTAVIHTCATHPPKDANTTEEDDWISSADLLSVVVIDHCENQTNVVSVSDPVGVKFSYQIKKPGLFVPAIAIYSPDGALVFWSVPSSQITKQYRLIEGSYESVVWLPRDILNIGIYSVTVALVDPGQSPMRRHFQHEQVVSFQTLGARDIEKSASGILPRTFPGPLRPKLDWSFNKEMAVQSSVFSGTETQVHAYPNGPPLFLMEKKVALSIDTSGFCNARCDACPWPFIPRSNAALSLDQFKTVLGRFAGFEFTEFAFNSINEPFADKTILEKLGYFIDQTIKTDVLFFSSNWLIPKAEQISRFVSLVEKAIALGRIRKISLNATISGIDEHSYNILQGGERLKGSIHKYKGLDFQRAKSTLFALVVALQNGISRDGNFVINIKGYGDIFTTAQFSNYWSRELLTYGVEKEFIDQKVRILHNHGFTSFARSASSISSEASGRCSMNWLSEKVVIGPDGGFGLCCQEGARKANLGNLLESDLGKIVASPEFFDQFAVVTGSRPCPEGHTCQRCEFFTTKGEGRIGDA